MYRKNFIVGGKMCVGSPSEMMKCKRVQVVRGINKRLGIRTSHEI